MMKLYSGRMLRFILASPDKGAEHLSQKVTDALLNHRQVLWLVSGGSNIPISVSVLGRIPADLTPNLTIMAMDERFGIVGHKDSNVSQLQRTGIDLKHATLLPVLEGRSLDATTKAYAKQTEDLFARHDIIIGQFGIGTDGHTAGILPNSPASEDISQLVVSYQGPDYSRITLTFAALRRVTTAFAFAYGADKLTAIRQLASSDSTLADLPASILQAIPEAYVYNNQIPEGGTQT